MSYPRYPKYKDSGVDWLGEVPEHWRVGRLKHEVRLLTEKTDRRDHPVGLENIESWTGRLIPTESAFEGEGIAFKAGDILFGKLRPYLAKVFVASAPGEAVGDFHVLRPAGGLDSRFAQSIMLNREFISIVDGSTFGSKMPRASWEFVGAMVVPVPPQREQVLITKYLERETAKIGALISEQRRLIQILKEKRQAIISHAVTKGLNPDAQMKSSGVEWLGEIPAHWQVAPLMRLTPDDRQIMYGIVLPGPHVEGGVPIVKGGDVKSDRLKLETLSRTTIDIESAYVRSRLSGGDIVYSIRGSIGEAEIVPDELTGANVTQDAARVAPRHGVHGRWLLAALRSADVFRQLESRVTGATIRGINIFNLKRALIPTPPEQEQREIASFVDREDATLATLIAEAEISIRLLQERRAALISAAVTGKIDVRNLTSPSEPLVAAAS